MATDIIPSPARVQGLDVSHFQGTVDWGEVATAGMAFAFLKASDGVTLVDPMFQTNREGAKAAGLLYGAYHFFEPADDPHQQAEFFLSVVGSDPGDLPPVLDVEKPGDASVIVAGVQTWLNVVQQAIGRTPILYTNPTFWDGLAYAGDGKYPLWIAEYEVEAPKIPDGWTSWTFWQYSQSGSVVGVTGNVDLDVFQGTLQDLEAFRSQVP